MFKKLMAMIKSPKISGGSTSDLKGQRWVKSYDVILANMEDSPAYPLSHQLTIGSEIGNIIINDPSVSPRHATVLLQDEVISIIDHGSVSGTFVNGTKIPAGKFIILEDTDKISAGDLELKIGVKTSAVEDTGLTPPGHDHIEDEEETEEVEEVEETELEEDEEVEEDISEDKTITKSKVYVGKPKASALATAKKPKKKIEFTLPSYDATNSIVRVMALAADLLLSYIIIVIFLPFDDFRNFLYSIPAMIAEAGDFTWQNIWFLISEDAKEVTDVIEEFYKMANEFVPVYPLLLVFFLNRLITTIIFGVSLSELFFGVRANFNKIWARIGGMFRVIVGMFTWPFLIFDLPSLASKRTFKEFITLTNTYVGSRVSLFFGIVLYFPLLVVLLLLAPMVIGLEVVEPVPFLTTVSQRVKPKPPAAADAPVIQEVTEGSRHFGISLKYDPQKLSLIPSFRFKGEKAKLNMKASLDLFHREDERQVSLELFKTFSMKELLALGLSGNFLIHEEFKTLHTYAFSAENTNRFFKAPDNVKKEEAFGRDVVKFTEMAMGLSVDTLPDLMTTKTPFIKSIVDYRNAMLGLFEYKNFSDLSVVKVGKILCIRATYDAQKPFDLIMPLIRGEGRIFRISYDSKKDIAQFRNKIYKFTLDGLTWGLPASRDNVETYQSMEVIDLFTTDVEKSTLSASKAQALYGYYFEKSAEVIKAGFPVEYEIWKLSVKNVTNVIPYLKQPVVEMVLNEDGSQVEVEDVKSKLKSNFSDLFNALENKNKSFFGIEEVPTV